MWQVTVTIVLIYREENWDTKKLGDFPKGHTADKQ